MAETGVPGDLTPLKEPLIEAVTNAYMAKQVPDSNPGFHYDHGDCGSKEFRYNDDRTGLDNNVYCSYPDGQWKIDWTWQKDPSRSPGETVGDSLTLFDAAAKFQEIRTTVSAWIDPWIACEDPNGLTTQINGLAHVIDQLYVQDEVRLGGNPVSGSDNGASVPVSDVQSAIADMRSELSSLNGLAIDALERAYVNDVGLTISGQRAVAAVAALAVAGEAEAWGRAFGNLADFIKKATADFNSFAKSHGASGEGGATTLSVLSGTAGAASAASFAFPPAAAALGVVSGLAGIGSTFWPQEEAVAATILVLKGDDFGSYWDSFKESIKGVDRELTDAEYNLAMMCRKVLEDVSTHPDSFSITAKGPQGTPQAGDNLPRFLDTNENSGPSEIYAGDDVKIVHSKLHNVAGMIEHVGDHQRTVAGEVNSSGSGSSSWDRQYLDGVIIGWGPTGHQADFTAVVDGLVDLLMAESKTAHRIAEQCIDVSTGFRKTDAQIEAELDKAETSLYP